MNFADPVQQEGKPTTRKQTFADSRLWPQARQRRRTK